MTSHGQTLLGEMIRTTISAREVIENHRPDWLNGMELDFWVPEWNLAFEFQGDQHFTPVFGLDAYAAQAVRDKLKRKICEARGIMLIAFDAAALEPHKMSCKLQYHIARLNPAMKKGERKKLLRRILSPKWGCKRERKHLLKEKYAYCRKLKASFGSHTAFKKGSNARHEAKTAQWQGIPWWEVAKARHEAQARYNTNPPLPRYGMGMSRAQRFTPLGPITKQGEES